MSLTAQDLIARAQLPTTEAELCLEPTLIMQWRDLLSEWERASDQGESLGIRSPKAELGDRLRALDEQIKAATIKVKVRALSAAAWAALRAKHPGENPGSVSLETFSAAALAACAYDPPFTPDEAQALMAQLSDGQQDLLIGPIFLVNEKQLTVPFDERVSARTPANGS